MSRHLIFYDGDCALCNRAVHFLTKRDKKRLFEYISLQSPQAHELLTPPIELDTLILLENKTTELRYGKGALRILWHLGGPWRLLGVFSFLPAAPANLFYRLIARHRHFF